MSKFLYTPPPGQEKEPDIVAWHAKMSELYTAMPASRVPSNLRLFLRKAGIDRDWFPEFGIIYDNDAGRYTPWMSNELNALLDHPHVLVRRSDKKRYVLGEPYQSVQWVENYPIVQKWRAIGSEVIVSPETGWFAGNTISVLISAPDLSRAFEDELNKYLRPISKK